MTEHRLSIRASSVRRGWPLVWCRDCDWCELWDEIDFDLVSDTPLAQAHHDGEPF